jgi:hypothetical protein
MQKSEKVVSQTFRSGRVPFMSIVALWGQNQTRTGGRQLPIAQRGSKLGVSGCLPDLSIHRISDLGRTSASGGPGAHRNWPRCRRGLRHGELPQGDSLSSMGDADELALGGRRRCRRCKRIHVTSSCGQQRNHLPNPWLDLRVGMRRKNKGCNDGTH